MTEIQTREPSAVKTVKAHELTNRKNCGILWREDFPVHLTHAPKGLPHVQKQAAARNTHIHNVILSDVQVVLFESDSEHQKACLLFKSTTYAFRTAYMEISQKETKAITFYGNYCVRENRKRKINNHP